ncbi:MAG: hypothetical protein JO093_04575 [Acidobacteria bacterium]|nr:hypothetical protein [Acidobacteriota bacterium]MBV9070058.1 hypothetical protein [Acidobacteriota bacterium]MBV9184867.1 hypothetical protein [Acidobacteriota bacterium]
MLLLHCLLSEHPWRNVSLVRAMSAAGIEAWERHQVGMKKGVALTGVVNNQLAAHLLRRPACHPAGIVQRAKNGVDISHLFCRQRRNNDAFALGAGPSPRFQPQNPFRILVTDFLVLRLIDTTVAKDCLPEGVGAKIGVGDRKT